MKHEIWFNLDHVLTKNRIFNMVVSMRGGGKTFSFKEWAIKDFLRNGNEFVYGRRYKTELDVKSFFKDIAFKFPDVEFLVKGRSFYINNRHAGEAICLSQGITKKSVVFSSVNKFLYDEFIIDKKTHYKYLNNEPKQLLDMIETINRLRLDGNDIKTILFGNAIEFNNPYFLFFNVKFNQKKQFKTKNIYAEIYENEAFKEVKLKSRFGQLIQEASPSYVDYAVNSNFYLDNYNLVEKKSGTLSFWGRIVIAGKYYGLWVSLSQGKIYVSHDYKKDVEFREFVFTREDLKPNTMLIKSYNSDLRWFFTHFKLGNVYFETVEIKNNCLDIFWQFSR